MTEPVDLDRIEALYAAASNEDLPTHVADSLDDLPALVAECRRLRAALEQARKALIAARLLNTVFASGRGADADTIKICDDLLTAALAAKPAEPAEEGGDG